MNLKLSDEEIVEALNTEYGYEYTTWAPKGKVIATDAATEIVKWIEFLCTYAIPGDERGENLERLRLALIDELKSQGWEE